MSLGTPVPAVNGGGRTERTARSWAPAWAPSEKRPRVDSGASFEVAVQRELSRSGRPDSNRRRPAWEAGILPSELRPQITGPMSRADVENIALGRGERKPCAPTHDAQRPTPNAQRPNKKASAELGGQQRTAS